MAISTTANFESTFSIDEVIEEAYERCGVQSITGHQLKSARRTLNILFQEWGNRGLHYWTVGNTNINLVQGQAEYIFYRTAADGTSAVTAGGTTSDQADSPLTKVDRSTYTAFSNKNSQGTPSQYWVQRLIDKTTVTIYPTPSSTTASNFVYINFIKRITNAGDYTNVGDLPYRFVPCMVSGLAFYLAQKWALERVQQLKLLYEDELQRALQEDGSPSSSYITPKTYYPGS